MDETLMYRLLTTEHRGRWLAAGTLSLLLLLAGLFLSFNSSTSPTRSAQKPTVVPGVVTPKPAPTPLSTSKPTLIVVPSTASTPSVVTVVNSDRVPPTPAPKPKPKPSAPAPRPTVPPAPAPTPTTVPVPLVTTSPALCVTAIGITVCT